MEEEFKICPSCGYENVFPPKKKGPSFAGDTIHVEAEVIESRPSSKDPRRGLVRTRNQIVNQKDETVIIYSPLRLMVGKVLLESHWE